MLTSLNARAFLRAYPQAIQCFAAAIQAYDRQSLRAGGSRAIFARTKSSGSMLYRYIYFLIAIAFGLTGCGGDVSNSSNQRSVDSQRSETAYFTQVKEVHWATTESFGKRAYRFVFNMTSVSNCDFSHHISGEVTQVGPQHVLYIENGSSFGTSSFKQYEVYHASAAGNETSRTDPTGRYSIQDTRRYEEIEGILSVTLVSEGQKPIEIGPLPNISFAVSFSCNQPFDLVSAARGDEAFNYDYSDINGTVVGVNAAGIGGGVMFGELTQSIMSPYGFAYVHAAPSNQFGNIDIETPTGTVTYMPTPLGADFESAESVSGDYRIGINRVSAVLDDFVVSIFGIEPDIDISSGFLSQSLIP